MSEQNVVSLNPDWQTLYQHFFADAHHRAATTDMVKLQHWPDLDAVPDEHVDTVTRICALLWAKPTVARLIAPILGVDHAHANSLLQVLHACGHVEFSHDGVERPDAAEKEEIARLTKSGGRISFIDKLRQQLLDHYNTR